MVLASDSQETTGQIKATTEKLRLVGDRMAWGGAGDAALIHRVAAEHAAIEASLASERWAVASAIGDVTRPVQLDGRDSHIAFGNAPPPMFAGIFCWYDPDETPCIWQVAPNAASSQFRSRKAAIGSGQPSAEVALASVAHLRVHELDLERLQMVAWKSVFDVITTSAYGVDFPIRLAVIQPGSARVLNADESSAVRDSVNAWLERQRDVLGALAEVSAPESESAEASASGGGHESDVGIEPPPLGSAE